jgi:adenylylsulfate reductase subunit A
MALPNKPLGELKAVKDPEVVEKEVDILIVGEAAKKSYR